jgi:hypothetical protein
MTTGDASRGREDSETLHGEPHNGEPTEIETLLPWYAVGRLNKRDRRRVEEALRADPQLARQADLVREELAETINLNETLGAPSAHAMERLMAAIDAETTAARNRRPARALGQRFANFIAGFSPRTLSIAASFAALAIVAQASVLVGMFAKPQNLAQATIRHSRWHGTFALVRFARQASAAEITKFLQNYKGTLVDGPRPGGLYQVRFGAIPADQLSHIAAQLHQEPIVEYVQFTPPGN